MTKETLSSALAVSMLIFFPSTLQASNGNEAAATSLFSVAADPLRMREEEKWKEDARKLEEESLERWKAEDVRRKAEEEAAEAKWKADAKEVEEEEDAEEAARWMADRVRWEEAEAKWKADAKEGEEEAAEHY